MASLKGYNQSGGGYLIIISTIVPAQLNVYRPGGGSGGATDTGSFTQATSAELPGNISSLFTVGKLIKDMGRTAVSASRTFRKVQAVVGSSGTFGVSGNTPNYASFYLETGYEGAETEGLPLVARYM